MLFPATAVDGPVFCMFRSASLLKVVTTVLELTKGLPGAVTVAVFEIEAAREVAGMVAVILMTMWLLPPAGISPVTETLFPVPEAPVETMAEP
ncbi:hypothetical protein D3C85_1020930 [compost metagenome]